MTPADRLRNLALSLPGTSTHVEFGSEAWFVDGIMFAALAGSRLTMHLPPAELTKAMRRGVARPLVSMGAIDRNGWVEVRLDLLANEELDRLLHVAHDAARNARRRGRAAKPPRARRTRPSPRR